MKFDNDPQFNVSRYHDAELLCPRCGESNLHHHTITVFDRNEDAAEVLRTTVAYKKTTSEVVADKGSGNPSNRRDGLTISFSCEHCEESTFLLSVYQHKGSTYMAWTEIPVSAGERLDAMLDRIAGEE